VIAEGDLRRRLGAQARGVPLNPIHHRAHVLRAARKRGLRSEPVFQYILDCFKNDRDWSFPGLQGKVPPALLSQLARALFEKASAGTIEEAQECLKSLRKFHLQNRLKDIQKNIARSEKTGEKEELLALLYQKQDITKQILSMS